MDRYISTTFNTACSLNTTIEYVSKAETDSYDFVKSINAISDISKFVASIIIVNFGP